MKAGELLCPYFFGSVFGIKVWFDMIIPVCRAWSIFYL